MIFSLATSPSALRLLGGLPNSPSPLRASFGNAGVLNPSSFLPSGLFGGEEDKVGDRDIFLAEKAVGSNTGAGSSVGTARTGDVESDGA